MKVLMIDGRLGRDAVIETTAKQGRQCIRFSMATNVYKDGKDETEWFDVSSFDSFIINTRSKVLKKGSYVMVTGTPTTELYTGKDGQTRIGRRILADRVDLLYSKAESDNGQETPKPQTKKSVKETAPSDGITGISIPSPSDVSQATATVNAVDANDTPDDDDLPF